MEEEIVVTEEEETQRTTLLLHQLPRHIIEAILLLLSVKSLLTLKCVSKWLCCMISDQGFVRAHFLKSSSPCKPPFTSPPPFIFVDRMTSNWATSSRDKVRSSNGLLCYLSGGKDFTLRNPSTRKYKKLPPLMAENKTLVILCGFGYVESTDDYKVLALSRRRRMDGGAILCRINIYSLKTDCWRRLDGFYRVKTANMDPMARHVGGMLYWLRTYRVAGEPSLRWNFVTFDLDKERFGSKVTQPRELLKQGQGSSSYLPKLGVLHGKPCVLCIYSNTADLWIITSSSFCWTRVAIFPQALTGWGVSNKFGVFTDGKICRKYDPLFYYLPEEMRMRSLSIVNLDMDISNRMCVHKSLVSLGNKSVQEDGNACYGEDGVVDLDDDDDDWLGSSNDWGI